MLGWSKTRFMLLLPTCILLHDILDDPHPFDLPCIAIWIGRREKFLDIFQRVFYLYNLLTHRMIQGREIDGVTPVVVDRHTRC